MSVSVVIPAINEATRVGRAVRSAFDAGADEVVVVDGGSVDGTVFAARDTGATVIHARPGRGPQQNAGAAATTGEVLLFLHADSVLSPTCIKQIDELRPQLPFGAFQQRIDAVGWRYRMLERSNAWRASHWGLPYGDQAIFLPRNFFFELGQFPNVPIMEDYWLMRRARRQRRPVLLAGPVITSARRWQRHGVVRQTLRNWSMVLNAQLGACPDDLAKRYLRHDAADRDQIRTAEFEPHGSHPGGSLRLAQLERSARAVPRRRSSDQSGLAPGSFEQP